MPRDYAKYTAPKQTESRFSYRLIWLSVLVALLIPATLFILHSKTLHLNFQQTKATATPAKKKIIAKTEKKKINTKEPASYVPKFDFYTLLSNRAANPKLAQKTDSVTNKPYALQVAALRHKDSVLQLKERLSLLGFEVFIIERPDSDLKYRINVGRYRTLAQAMAEQVRLSENNFSSILIKRQPRKAKEHT